MDNQNEKLPRLLEEYFGFRSFRPGQEEIITHILAGGERVAVLPTGGGKSLCYLLPAFLFPAKTLVVSPLIALIQDQVEHAERAGLAAVYWKRETGAAELERARVVFTSPEFFLRHIEQVQPLAIAHIVIDEAHCVSDWGGSFRPSYAEIARILEYIPCANISLFTASADRALRLDLARRFGLREPRYFVRGFDRPNIAWHCMRSSFPLLFALNYLSGARQTAPVSAGQSREYLPERAIVYCRSRLEAARSAALLQAFDLPARPFHAGMSSASRAILQEAFSAGEVRILCATSAFGMGVDVPSIRTVIHLHAPDSCNAYYQEAGRAGRDGEPALALLLHTPEREYDPRDMLRKFLAQTGTRLPERISEKSIAALCVKRYASLDAGEVLAFLLHHGAYRREHGGAECLREYCAQPDMAARIRDGLREEQSIRRMERAWAARYTAPDCPCRRRALLSRFEEDPAGTGSPVVCGGCDRCASPFSAALERAARQTEEETLLLLRARSLPWARRSALFQGVRGARLAALFRFLRYL